MALYDDDDGVDDYEQDASAYAIHPEEHQMLNQTGVANKVPPAYDGRTSWFAYEELIDDWVDMTTLEPTKHGPALKSRLSGDANLP